MKSDHTPEPVTGPDKVIMSAVSGKILDLPFIVTGVPVIVISVPYIHCIHLVFTLGLSLSCGGTQLNWVRS